jgi:hypothetical protein
VISGSNAAAERISVTAKSVHSDTDRSTKLPPPLSVNVIPPTLNVCTDPATASDYAAFYNPRQNGVARKYWDRVRKKRAINALRQNDVCGFDDPTFAPTGGNGFGSESLVNGNVPQVMKANGVHATVVTASVENHSQRCAGLPDEQQPLLPILTPLATRSTVPAVSTNDTVRMDNLSPVENPHPVKSEQMARYGTLPAPAANDAGRETSVVNGCGGSSTVTCGETGGSSFLEQLEQRIPSTSCSVNQLSTDDDCCDLSMLPVSKLHDNNPLSRSLPNKHQSGSSEAVFVSAGAGATPTTAYAFMNKNYQAIGAAATAGECKVTSSSLSATHGPTKLSDVDTAATDVWLPHSMDHSKLKTETSV